MAFPTLTLSKPDFSFSFQQRQRERKDIPAIVNVLQEAGCKFFCLDRPRNVFTFEEGEVKEKGMEPLKWITTPVDPKPNIQQLQFRLINAGPGKHAKDFNNFNQEILARLTNHVRELLLLPIVWVDGTIVGSEFRKIFMIECLNIQPATPSLRLVGSGNNAAFLLSFTSFTHEQDRLSCIVDFINPTTGEFMSPLSNTLLLPTGPNLLDWSSITQNRNYQ